MGNSTINQLASVTSLSSSDKLVVYDSNNGDARKASLSSLLTFLEANFASPEYTVVISAPIDGFNQQLAAATTNIWLILNPDGSLSEGTITMPPVADCFDGQQLIVVTTSSIVGDGLNVAGNGATVLGAPSQFGSESGFVLRFNTLQQTWYTIAQNFGSQPAFSTLVISTAIADINSNEFLKVAFALSAINEITIGNAATGSSPSLQASGGDTNVSLELSGKGTGRVKVLDSATLNQTEVVGITSTQTLTNKTLTSPVISTATLSNCTANVVLFSTQGTLAALSAFYPPATYKGARAYVTDANTTLTLGIGTVVVGSGANFVPVYSDGTNYRIG